MSPQDPNNSNATLVGRTIGDVVIERRLKVSRSSLLYRGTQQSLNRPVLLKIWPPLREGQDPATAKLHRGIFEARVLSRVRHPNVITLYDSGLYRERYPYVVTEFLFGGSLRDLLDVQGHLSPQRALGILQQVASALEELHRQNIIHRNLTPRSLFFENLAGSGQELVKLAGFDMARIHENAQKQFDDSAILHKTRTNPQYMAPEQVLGGGVTASIDLYACGILLYEMLTGRLPYQHTSPPELWDEIVATTPIPLADAVPELAGHSDLQNLVDQLLAKRLNARLSDPRKLRLISNALLQRITARAQQDLDGFAAFPVLETSGHVRALNRPLPNVAPLTQPSPRPQHMPSAPQAPSSPRANARVPHIEPSTLAWSILHPRALEHAQLTAAPYLVLAVLGQITGAFPPLDLLQGATAILSAEATPSARLLVLAPPAQLVPWLHGVRTCIKRRNLAAGMAFHRHFDADQRTPHTHVVSTAIDALTAAMPGGLLASRHAVEALNLSGVFVALDGASQGRYSSLMRLLDA